MSDVSRRTMLRNVAVAALAGGVTVADAQHVHHASAEEAVKAGGAYQPKLFNAHEWASLRRLCDLTFPGSLEGGAPEYIDLLASHNAEIAAIYTGGLAWLDNSMRGRAGTAFVEAKADAQTALLDVIAYRKNSVGDMAAGVRFFEFARKMIADAYYTSKVGIAELGFMGNQGMAQFQVLLEAVQYALKRSGL